MSGRWSRRFMQLSLATAASLVLELLAYGADIDRSVVRVLVSKQAPNMSTPWQFRRVTTRSYLGTIISGQRILTTAHAVRDATRLEMQAFGRARKHELSVAFVDYEINLALLRPTSIAALQGLAAIPVADVELAIGSEVSAYKARNSYKLTRIPAQLLQVSVYSSATSGYFLATYLLKIQQTGMGWAEPVIDNGQLIALTTGQDSNFLHAIPGPLIAKFLNDSHGQNYRGFPSAGIALSALDDPALRKMLAVDGPPFNDRGVRVAEVVDGGSAHGILQENDVILSVDGRAINEQGLFRHPKWGLISMAYLMNRRYAGDTIAIDIARGGATQRLDLPLQRFASNTSLVRHYRTERKEPHLIVGGLVFQELSRNYLEQWGKEWHRLAPFDLLYIFHHRNKPSRDHRRVVLLARVLADEFNRGYDKLQHAVVDSVNGSEINSLRGLMTALTSNQVTARGKKFIRVQLANGEGEILLMTGKEMLAAHERIANVYNVGSASFWQGQPHAQVTK